MSHEQINVAVLPSGRFGTALAVPLAENAERVNVYVRSWEDAEIFERTRANQKYFPGVKMPDNVRFSGDFREALRGVDTAVIVPPVKHLRELYGLIADDLPKDCSLVIASKGMEEDTNMRVSQILKDVNPKLSKDSYAVLSGPNFADEIVRGLPAATVIASENETLAQRMREIFRTKYFIPYITDDVIGVELGGALKNPVAMAVGICIGMGYGKSAAFALKNRGLREMIRLAVVLGADERTLMGESGDGDLSLSCQPPGRNYESGVLLGKGEDPKLLFQSEQTIEALYTVKAAVSLARENNVEVPIFEGLYGILYEGLKPHEVVEIIANRNHLYEDPQPVLGRKLRFPMRLLNRIIHLWQKS